MKSINLSNVLFLDVECVPEKSRYDDLDSGMQLLRDKKAKRVGRYIDEEMSSAELYEHRSGIFAEFGKIIVISVGYFFRNEDGTKQFRVKSFAGDDEKKLLEEFFGMLNAHYSQVHHQLCGHNIKEFDIPYICRRAVIHDLLLPKALNVSGKKPWEIHHIDTMELWRFGDRKSFTSLDLLCRVFGIETPKDDISGEQVAEVYYKQGDLARIQLYCEKDVVATARVLLKFLGRSTERNPLELS